MALGKWALIDIETTGIDEGYDEIIDVGFLSFNGTKLEKKFSSLVRTDIPLSQFIQKLTGISQSQVRQAPLWDNVKVDVLELDEYRLLAHNAAFEQKFLNPSFEEHLGKTPQYDDSLFYLALLNPGRSQLNLDSFIREWGLREAEVHRGYEDSLDLLKVLILETYKAHQNSRFKEKFLNELSRFDGEGFWFKDFFQLTSSELYEIAEQVDLALDEVFESIQIKQEDIEEESIELEISFNGASIENFFKNEAIIQKVLPYYKYRDSQVALAKRVGQSFGNKVHSLIQAPTGTGKTLGYLLPVSVFSLETQEKVLISTGTKTLQNQAETKDVPLLKKLLGKKAQELRITKLIGSQNHFCELLFRQKNENGELLSYGRFEEIFTQSYFEMLFFKNQEALINSERLTREQIPFSMKKMNQSFKELEEDIAVDFRSCSGHKCPFNKTCSYIQGLREAKDSNIILGNHSLLLNWPNSFERPQYIIIDEAHKLENEATNSFTKEASSLSLENLAKSLAQSNSIGSLFYLLAKEMDEKATPIIESLRNQFSDSSKLLLDHLKPLETLIESYFKKSPRYTSLYWNELPMINKEEARDNSTVSIINHLESLLFIIEGVYKELTPHAVRLDLNSFKEEMDVSAWSKFESFYASLEDILVAIKSCLNFEDGFCQSLSFHETEGYLLKSSPIDVGKEIFTHVINESTSVVMTSATLADEKGLSGTLGAEWMTGHLYIDKEKRFQTGLYLPPVYDYKNNAKVFLVSDTVPMHKPEFVPSVLDKVIPFIKSLGGRTLALFSSKVRFEMAREILLKEFEGKIPLFIQGMGKNLVEEFKESENGILLGMESFGEGIDVQGHKLQFILIDKIPDLRMDYVIQKRREFFEKSFGDEFNQYFLAYRGRLLQQKLGRLLRTESDKGVAIIVDSRTNKWKARTKQTFKNLLSPYELQDTSFEQAIEASEKFLGRS